MSEIEITGLAIGTASIKTTQADLDAAIEGDYLDNEYDHALSNINGMTVIVMPDGQIVDPYSGKGVVDVIALAEPVLALIPTGVLEQYLAERKAAQ